MDGKPEELQFLGLFGICKESCKIVSSRKKIFSQITLSLILPLSFSLLAETPVLELLLAKINTHKDSPKKDKTFNCQAAEWTFFFLFKLAYNIILSIFSLLSTSTIVYTIGCIYTSKDVTFRKVMSVIPNVWKRLIVTFLWFLLFLLGLMSITVMFTALFMFLLARWAALVIAIIWFLIYFIAVIYLCLVANLALIVSVLETIHGLEALKKSYELIKGKAWTATAILIVMDLASMAIRALFGKFVAHAELLGGVGVLLFGSLLFLSLTMLFLLGVVIQTVFYFVCKSYHCENIDKSCLGDELDCYLGKYVPLNAKTMQLDYHNV